MVASVIALILLGAPDPGPSFTAPKPAPSAPLPDLKDALRSIVAGKEPALLDLEKIAAARPKDLRVLYALGTAHKLSGRSEAAVRTFRAAVALAKKGDGIHAARPWWGLVRLYRDAGLEKEAAAATKSFLDVARKLKGLEGVVKRVEADLKK